ncbi:MAG: DUF4114 domain-containing protein [Sedimenticolaceae bacterium]
MSTRRSSIGGFTSGLLPALVLTLGIAMFVGASRPAVAGVVLDEPILGGQIRVAQDGDVWAKFLGSDAGFFNTLYLDGYDDVLFDKSSPLDSEILLGSFSAGTELVFRIDVTDSSQSFFSGDASRNPDGLAHALAITTFDASADTYVTTVGFEDLLGGGDLDFNDFMFQLTNVIDPPIPAPSVVMLLGIGLAGLGYQRRKQLKAS